ncbi:hypothetical protein O181_032718 [Austropuccinia psidii MF-1]|uniref:Uncharacterized protein n=1 Tax=Austropuccinia psidii MF-1 TaxID=1389203 RepID=A0A9Q3D257_9BASI|nr:hypothetical protein [Austropuccinia psidii MF-1]
MEGFTPSTSSPSSSSLPSASRLVGESEISLILLTTPWLLILEMGLPQMGIGSPTLVHLATSPFLDPVTKTRHQHNIKPRRQQHLLLEWSEVPSGVGTSETGSSFLKVPSFLLHKYHLTLETGTPLY